VLDSTKQIHVSRRRPLAKQCTKGRSLSWFGGGGMALDHRTNVAINGNLTAIRTLIVLSKERI